MFHRFDPELLADRAREAYIDSRKFARRHAKQANSFIHREPMAATVLAVVTGLLLGLISPHRTKKAAVSRPARRIRAAVKATKR